MFLVTTEAEKSVTFLPCVEQYIPVYEMVSTFPPRYSLFQTFVPVDLSYVPS